MGLGAWSEARWNRLRLPHAEEHGAGFTRAVAGDRLKVKSNDGIRIKRGAGSKGHGADPTAHRSPNY